MKILSRDFTRAEKILIAVLMLILVGLAYYQFVEKTVRQSIINAQSEVQMLQTELTAAQHSLDSQYRVTETTVTHTEELIASGRADMVAIGRWLEGSPNYYLQNFEDSGNLIKSGLHGFTPLELQDFATLSTPFFGQVSVRGVN